MSRILKALATIESKGATLTLSLPREASPQRPKRREGADRAELSLAALEAYLQAALSAEQQQLLAAEVGDAVALYCTTGEAGPSIGAPDLAAAAIDASATVTAWVRRDTGPQARSTLVDREWAESPWEELEDESPVNSVEADEFAAFHLTAIPAEEVLESAQAELLDWSDDIYAAAIVPFDAPAPTVEVPIAVLEAPATQVIENLDSLVFQLTGDLTLGACGYLTTAEVAATHEFVEPIELPGWPDAFPTEAACEPPPEFDVESASWFVGPPEFGWLADYDLLPAEAHEQRLLIAPDWIEVDAAIEALPLVVENPPSSATPPSTLERTAVRRRLSSRDLLPDPAAWTECRAVADTLRALRSPGKPASYLLVELNATAGRTPLVAPLAAMLAEVSGNRVLLVDADYGRADAVDQLSGAAPRGFADVMERPDDWPALVLASAVPRLDLLPSGASTPHADTQFAARDWLDTLARAYQFVLLHASWPVSRKLADLVSAADATLLVATLGELDEVAANQCIGQLRDCGARVEGCVVVEGGGEKENGRWEKKRRKEEQKVC